MFLPLHNVMEARDANIEVETFMMHTTQRDGKDVKDTVTNDREGNKRRGRLYLSCADQSSVVD